MTASQLFLLVESASLALASLVHSGRLVGGYEHLQARTAEGVIAGVLLVGLLLTWIRRRQSRTVAVVASGLP
jgi:hypothetical protein